MSTTIFRDNLRYLMKRRILNNRTLAERLQVKECRVKAWYEGRAMPHLKDFPALCEVLGCQDNAIVFLTVPWQEWRKQGKRLPDAVKVNLHAIGKLVSEALEQ